MILVNKKKFEIGIHKAGEFHWKPTWSGVSDNFHKVENGKNFKFVNTWSYYIQTTVQMFWLGFILYIKIKPELLSGKTPNKYVKFEDTHLVLMDLPEGNWND